jgi:hypothetical protein
MDKNHTTNNARQILVCGTESGFHVFYVLEDLGRFKGTTTSEDLFLRVGFWVFGNGLEKLTSVLAYRGRSAVYSAKSSRVGRICAKVMNATCNSPLVYHCSHQETFLRKVCIADERICGH